MLKEIKRLFRSKKNNTPLFLPSFQEKTIGRALFSYLASPPFWSSDSSKFNGHTNKYEAAEIAHILCRLGYSVDCIDFTQSYLPVCDYDIAFDIHKNLQAFAPFLPEDCLKILHITGSYPRFHNKAEVERVDALERRKGLFYTPKRIDSNLELFDRSLRIADVCSLIGNASTLLTFPEGYRNKIHCVPVTASLLEKAKGANEFVPDGREFLWFFGTGAVHKGLDIVLDVFAELPMLKLHVVGPVCSERDFVKIYNKELYSLPNITYHGPLDPSSKEFHEILESVFAFIAPSCSEGTSTAVVTCLQAGLYPIISKYTGVALPKNCGVYLETCSKDEVKEKVLDCYQKNKICLEKEIAILQEKTIKTYSREAFSKAMHSMIEEAIHK